MLYSGAYDGLHQPSNPPFTLNKCNVLFIFSHVLCLASSSPAFRFAGILKAWKICRTLWTF